MQTAVEQRRLGRSDLYVSPLGLGCWQFSEARGFSGRYWDHLAQKDVRQVVKASLEGGINWFDTAEVYGWGRSEAALADALTAAGCTSDDVVVATKWWPALRSARSIGDTIEKRIARLGSFRIDLHQIHAPISVSSIGAQMAAMASLVRGGRIRYVGVSNFSAKQMRKAHALLADQGYPLVSNQMPYSLLDRRIEFNGILDAARELNITIIAYSPLAQGLLTGKFHDDPALIRGRGGYRKFLPAFWKSKIMATLPLIEELRRIADRHGVTPAQVALNWLMAIQGEAVVVIPGATTVEQASDNVSAMGLSLDQHEMGLLDALSRQFARV